MKNFYFSILTLLMCFISTDVYAYDIGVANADGVTIYYEWTDNNTELSVTSGSFPNKYSGNVVIPESVEYDGKSYSVTSIGSSAFSYCTGLTSLTIPNSVTSIERYAFSGCSGLISINVESGNPIYDSRDCNAIIERSSNTLILGCKNTIIPNSVASIGHSAFAGCVGLTSVTIPNSVTSIGYSAFNGCTGLTSVTIPNSVVSLNTYAFANCTGLTSIIIPNSVTSIGDWIFDNCSNLTSVTIGSGVKLIGMAIFNGCNALTSIMVESGNSKYDSRDDCNAIIETSSNTLIRGCKGTIIPNSVTSIGEYAFEYYSDLTSITIPNSVTSIGYSVFNGCINLASINIPSSVTSIGDDAFSECNLNSVTVNRNEPISISAGVFSNSSDAILYVPKGCIAAYKAAKYWKEFKEIRDHDGNSEDNVFCYRILSITDKTAEVIAGEDKYSGNLEIPSSVAIDNVTYSVIGIGQNAFWDCSGLTSITIPNSVTSIGEAAFQNCSGLTSVVIPNSVTSIDKEAFNGCEDLTSITIGSGVTYITEKSFSQCPNLDNVYCMAEEIPNTKSDAFEGSYVEYATLHVPVGCVDTYKAVEPWNNFMNIVEMVEPEPEPGPEPEPVVSTNDKITVETLRTYLGKTSSISINLENVTTNFTAYQFDLTLPEGITLSKNESNKFLVTKTSRYEDDEQSLNITQQEGNTYRFLCFSMNNSVITGKNGAILNAIIDISSKISAATYEGIISNIIFTKTDGTQVGLNEAKFNIVVSSYIMGDANNDGTINVSDIVEIVNYIMNNASSRFVRDAADINADGDVNVTDIVRIVSVIMSNGQANSRGAIDDEDTSTDYLTLNENDDNQLSLSINNKANYVASQFVVSLSDGMTLDNISLNNKRCGDHVLVYSKESENQYKVLIYSLTNSSFVGNDGELLSIKTSGNGNVSIDDIIFVTSDIKNRSFSSINSGDGTTSIERVETSEIMNIYSIDGRLIRKQTTNTNGLPKGIYIINGKKRIVK